MRRFTSELLPALGVTLLLSAAACAGGDSEECPSAQPVRCSDICVDTASDHDNCGGCGNVCQSNQQCQSGQCQEFCDVEITYYQDGDGDLYGNPDATQVGCSQPTGYVTNSTDCDDSQRLVNPNAVEACNDIDDDCDGNTDEGCTCVAGDTQNCGITTGDCAAGTQTCRNDGTWGNCEDAVGATDETCNGTDEDCDGQTDEGLAEDSFENNDSCEAARALADADEDAGPAINTGAMTLYSSDLSRDADWYTFTATEAIHLCAGDPQCFAVGLTFTPPEGADYADYEVCLMSYSSTACSSAPDEELCTTAADWDPTAGAYYLETQWDGLCGLNDDRMFHVSVTRASGSDSSCEPYRLGYESFYLGQVECTY